MYIYEYARVAVFLHGCVDLGKKEREKREGEREREKEMGGGWN